MTCNRSTTISSVVAASCSLITIIPNICRYFRGTCSSASRAGTKAGTRWCRRRLPRSSAGAVSSDTRNVERACRGCYVEKEMSTLQEIKSAIENLSPHDKALLTAELFAMNAEPDSAALEAALQRGLKDVEAGRVRPVEEVKAMIPGWTSKS